VNHITFPRPAARGGGSSEVSDWWPILGRSHQLYVRAWFMKGLGRRSAARNRTRWSVRRTAG